MEPPLATIPRLSELHLASVVRVPRHLPERLNHAAFVHFEKRLEAARFCGVVRLSLDPVLSELPTDDEEVLTVPEADIAISAAPDIPPACHEAVYRDLF